MKIQIQSFLINGITGLMTGLSLFLLEVSIRFIYLYFWTFEQAPSGYWNFLIYYAIFGFIAGIGFSCLLAILKVITGINRRVVLLTVSISVLSALFIALILFIRMLRIEGLSLSLTLRHLGITLLGGVLFAFVAWFIGRMKNRFGTLRFSVGYVVIITLFVIMHTILLQSFSFNRVFAQLPESHIKSGNPNVLFLTIDTLRADRMGSYGYSKNITPNIDLLAKEGVLFEWAISQSPWTRPSFGSIFTSLYPSQHRAFVINDLAKGERSSNWGELLYDGGLSRDAVTMAEVFREKGYTTIALQSNWQASEYQNFDQGFQLFLYEPLFFITMWDRTFLGTYTMWLPALVGAQRRLPYWLTSAPSADRVYEVFKSLADRGFPQPFFIWINLMDPHSPYVVRDQRAFIEEADVIASYESCDMDIPTSVLSDAYDNEVQYADHYVGKIYTLLKDHGVLDNTLVIFLSDHGEDFGDHHAKFYCSGKVIQGRHHGHSLYNELLHVPLIIRYPSQIPQGLRIRELVSLIDVMPTVFDLARVTMSTSEGILEGESLSPLLAGKGSNRLNARLSFSERTFFGFEQKAVQDGHYKLILRPEKEELELYDLNNDPKERNNMATRNEEKTRLLRLKLDKWMGKMGPLTPSSSDPDKRPLSEEEKKRLKSLGYVN